MHPLVSRVPRLQMLAVFEAAARLGSLTAAASELGMTQSGVSRQITALERALEAPVFERHPNRVQLNKMGEALLGSVQSGFDIIHRGVSALKPPVSTFLLAANPGFAQQWLVPHLGSLQGALGDLDLRLRLFDRDAELATGDFDAAIHLCRHTGLPEDSYRLFQEEATPVASPGYARAHGLGPETPPAALLALDLLMLEGRDRQWMTWADWFAACGESWSVDRAKVSYNNYTLTIDDAIDGRGIALGWTGLVDHDLERGLLVPVGPRRARSDFAYLLIPGQDADRDSVERVATWLNAMIGIE